MKHKLRAHLRLGVVLVAVGVVAACQPLASVVSSITGGLGFHKPPQPDLRDSLCDPADQKLASDRGYNNDAVNFARANGYYGWCIPEYDDDQRLSDGNLSGKDYGPVAHVLAPPWLDTLTFNTTFVQVAILDVDPDPGSPAPFPYKQLGLGQFNCIYLRHPASGDTSFQSLIVPPDPTTQKCPVAPTAAASGVTALAVAMEQAAGVNITAYPPTTRFVEAGDGRTLIGVRCTNHWCAIRPTGNALETVALEGTSSTSISSPPGVIPPSPQDGVPGFTYAQALVKGWFDDQYLGVPDSTPHHGIHRQIRAAAIPDPNLGNLTIQDYITQPKNPLVYQPVGVTYFATEPDSNSKYHKVWGFSQGVNLVGMRAEVDTTVASSGLKIDTLWFTRVINARQEVKRDIKTVRMDHSKYFSAVYGSRKLQATMRWRWSDGDEDLWSECTGGCCLSGIK